MQATGLGDVISVFPAIKTLKLNYPEASISVMCWKNGSEIILATNPFVDQVITFKLNFSPDNFFPLIPQIFFKLGPRLRKEKFDCVISFHPNKIRWVIIKLVAPRYYVYQTEYLPITRSALEALSAAGCTEIHKEGYLDTRNYVEDINKFSLNNQDIVICLNLYVKSKMRHWHGFPELIEQLVKTKHQVVVIGQNEKHTKIKGVIDLVNQTTVQEMINIIKRSDLFVTADSGPMHVAFALGRPTIAIFGKSRPEDILPVEYRSNITPVYNAIECSPCAVKDTFGEKCDNVRCLDSISVEQVFKVIEEKLRLRRSG